MTSIVQEMEDDLNFSGNGRRPQFFRKWKIISISGYGRGPQFSGYGRGPQFLMEWKTTSSFQEMENNLSFQKMEDHFNSISVISIG